MANLSGVSPGALAVDGYHCRNQAETALVAAISRWRGAAAIGQAPARRGLMRLL